MLKKLSAVLSIGILSFSLSGPSSASSASTSASKDIVEVAAGAGSFNTLVAAVEAAGLVEALKGDGPFTVFAPTDAAFAKLPEGVLQSLLEDKEALKNILTYHVVAGKFMATDVVTLSSAQTLQGQSVRVSTLNGVKVDQANVIQTDIVASNGVIHVLDEVILPAQMNSSTDISSQTQYIAMRLHGVQPTAR